jgi:hypothetical protein
MSRDNLGCNTEVGRVYIQKQAECIDIISQKWNVNIFNTSDTEIADIDGIIVKNNIVVGAIEIKSRETTLEQLKKWGSYLITFEKLIKLRDVCKSLCINGLVGVFLIKDKKIVYWKVCNSKGEFLISLEAKVSTTQKHCNGDEIDRFNAYLSLEDMKEV